MVQVHDGLDRDAVALADLEQGITGADGIDRVFAGGGLRTAGGGRLRHNCRTRTP